MEPKVIAFYLPQFHRTPENDEWWGEGFTDWVSARNAVPYYRGHYQPRIPLHNNYYDLLDKKTMQWQANLARKAGVYGFCIYHYWFGGKSLLEKPAENLLKWKDIDINFCFSWANLSWIRSWSKYNKSGAGAWIAENKVRREKNDLGILIEQKYGNAEMWKQHFEYLLPFFQDDRYIKKDNKPIFVIHRATDIKQIKPMVALWNRLAKEQGFDGIYFVGTNCDSWESMKLDAMIRYEPFYTLDIDKKYRLIRGRLERAISAKWNLPQFMSYTRVWKSILNRDSEENVLQGGFIDLDKTPRMGTTGEVCVGTKPQKFYRFFDKLYRKNKRQRKEYIFLTAWNEWGEGAYLEPDQKYGFAYLRMIKKVVNKNVE